MPEVTRKLAAIMFTDIAGYTALSAKDEEKALELIDLQRELLKPIVLEHDGSWLKEIGDGLFLSFPSSKKAVNCAINIQQTIKEIEDLNLRIGIHQGDILEKEGDVFGDDVNIASRIEPFSAVGGVAISDKIHRDISGSPELITKYIGCPKLKGVKQDVKVYCITSHGLPETKLSEVAAKIEKKPTFWIKLAVSATAIIAGLFYFAIRGEPEVPSVGILYMENVGGEEDEFWARGITEDVIIEVASAGLIRVPPMKEILEVFEFDLPISEIAKNLRVKYLLTSSIHKKENRFDLRTQLIEAKTGRSVYARKWSESLDRASYITGTLADNILTSLGVETTRDFTKPPTNSPEAYELYLRGKYRYEKRQDMEDTEVARGLLRKAIELDENLIEAKVRLGWSYFETGGLDKAMSIYQECLIQSKNLDDKKNLGASINRIGNIYWQKGDFDKALEYHEQSLEIGRELGDKSGIGLSLHSIGIIYAQKGDYDKALEYFELSLEIRHELGDKSGIGASLNNIGIIYTIKGDYDKALEYFELNLEISHELGDKSGIGAPLNNIGIIYVSKGDYDKALEYYEQYLEISHELGDKRGIAISLNNIGDIYVGKGDYDKALEYHEQSLEISRELGDKYGEGVSLGDLGKLIFLTGNYPQSSAYFDSATKIWDELDDARQNLRTMSWWALSELKSGNSEAAKIKAGEVEKMMESTDPSDEHIVDVNWNLSQVYSALGDSKKGKQYLEAAYKEVLNRADRCEDKEARELFLTNVRENREVVAAWNELNK